MKDWLVIKIILFWLLVVSILFIAEDLILSNRLVPSF